MRTRIASGLIAAVILTGCATDAAIGPAAGPGTPAIPGHAVRPVDLGSCGVIAAPAGARQVAHYYAAGDQRWFWLGSSWLNLGPDAALYEDAGRQRAVGVHPFNAVWQMKSGSSLVGQVEQVCDVGTTAIAWQLFQAVSHDGGGIFRQVDYIQRVRTTGGVAPSAPGAAYGETRRVPFTAEFYYYRLPS